MAKGKKKDKKSKSKGASSTVISDTTTTTTVAAELPDYYYGTSTFHFPNKDKYQGEFCAHRAGLVWREGLGVYTTHDGQVYEGEWRDDRLVENKPVKIKFPNGAEYFGKLSKGKYNGAATYTLPNGLIISSTFNENKPIKETALIDILDKLWCGYTKNNTDATYLLPENEFYLNLDENKGKGIIKIKPTKPVAVEEQTIHEETEEEDEKVIFAKSTKTKYSDPNFENSAWFKRYKDFKDKHEAIKQKIKQTGDSSLEPDEMKWRLKYLKFKARRRAEKKRKRGKHSTQSETVMIREENPPVIVFYSTKQPEVVVEPVEEIPKSIVKEVDEDPLKVMYEKLKKEKEETEKRIREKFMQRGSKSEIYSRDLDETKNPDCSCKKRVCDCLLPCSQPLK